MINFIYRLKFKGALSATKTVRLSELREYVKSLEHLDDDQIIQLVDDAVEAHTPVNDSKSTGNSIGIALHCESFPPRDHLGRFAKRK
ncbi:hypothetical protein [Auritidibacter ignavus]|uniref:Uncharacterized protein n=1 Tax=Auritidibacter ignavus TaxID=678932 RepID=A0AAJ6AQ77_9MICC|nr:hypothetical protein [Auritidibacter ignavus]NIH72237.1 hypothetical protein [Auritidibacter ignavus]RMX23749.1 hypothetical protein DYI20_02720 [Auritidibacter ignavus]WGH87075.1 hypothetical protein QDX24_04570 [Auritidibacter ignavus]WGH89359.1 hypothetical protein QDX22_04565 [Auritidibacter ignavus]WGH91702.1 hypothetical protein QDX23_04910 [Auritidibacter ignavus]